MKTRRLKTCNINPEMMTMTFGNLTAFLGSKTWDVGGLFLNNLIEQSLLPALKREYVGKRNISFSGVNLNTVMNLEATIKKSPTNYKTSVDIKLTLNTNLFLNEKAAPFYTYSVEFIEI